MKRFSVVLCFVFSIVFSFCASDVRADRKTAIELNRQGYELYKQKKHGEAIRAFQKAVEADQTYGQAHYNLACTHGLLRKIQKEPCTYESYKSVIVEHLKQTLKYMPEKRTKMLQDSDLNEVHDTYGWQIIKGCSPETTKGVTDILIHVTWYGPAPGCYGPANGLDFQPNGTVLFWRLEIGEGFPERVYLKGTYQVAGNKIKFQFKNKVFGKNSFTGTLTGQGEIIIKGGPQKFSDDPDECSA